MSTRRALTFLEQRPEVDGVKLGVEGHSMGGRSTGLAAIAPSVKAASPSVGGSGYLCKRHNSPEGRPGHERLTSNRKNLSRSNRSILTPSKHDKEPTDEHQ
jgi:hypothetical protein